jgi:uncharacterized protein YbjT (DUF2867 family)
MEKKIMILVVGATSRVGMHVIPTLIDHGHAVRAMTRTPEKAEALQKLGAEVVQGDLRDPASLARACAGVESEGQRFELHHFAGGRLHGVLGGNGR